jgi:hypothetical protein
MRFFCWLSRYLNVADARRSIEVSPAIERTPGPSDSATTGKTLPGVSSRSVVRVASVCPRSSSMIDWNAIERVSQLPAASAQSKRSP